MDFEVRYDPSALRAMQEIAEYIHERSPSGARNVVADIKASADLLGHSPMMGRALESLPFRQIITQRYKYRIFYRVEKGCVTVTRIYHPSQLPEGT